MQRKKKNRVLELLEEKAGLTPQVASRFLNEVLVEHQANLAQWMYDTHQSDSDIYSEQDKLGLRYGALFLGYEEGEGRNINTHLDKPNRSEKEFLAVEYDKCFGTAPRSDENE